MASPFQQQSLTRKLIYFGMIVALFTVAIFFRLPRNAYSLESQALALEGREGNQPEDEVELDESALRLTLTGSRGVAVCGLWWMALEKQKRHEWNEMELIVRSLTKLQPHFISAWIFQSWNIAYNVSVESDQVKDKYYYITRGMELLSEGVRKNQDNPDLRFTMGQFHFSKFGVADEASTLRSLFEMSCIDPKERNPSRFRRTDAQGNKVIDPIAFEEFCRNYPHVVRRLRDRLNYDTPDKIVDFLDQNRRIPTRFVEETDSVIASTEPSKLKPDAEQFPILAPKSLFSDQFGFIEPSPDQLKMPQGFGSYDAARGWMSYAQDPVPPPDKDATQISPYDRRKYRMPKRPQIMLFRSYPARAQAYVAEYLEKDGWFDEGWRLDEAFASATFQQPTVPAGDGKAGEAWERAFQMYKRFGVDNGLYVEEIELRNLEDDASKLYAAYPAWNSETFPEDMTDDRVTTPEMRKGRDAHAFLFRYRSFRKLTNYAHFLYRSRLESLPDAVVARRFFYEADRLQKEGAAPERVLKLYDDPKACAAWRNLLLNNADFRADEMVQEETYELQLKYLDVAREAVQNQFGSKGLESLLVASQGLLRGLQVSPVGAERWFVPPAAVKLQAPLATVGEVLTEPILRGPFDFNDKDGLPLLYEESKQQVKNRAAQTKPQ